MDIINKYNLKFIRKKNSFGGYNYYCKSSNINYSPLALHLTSFVKEECMATLELIEHVENGKFLNDNMIFNDNTDVQIFPPNAVIDEDTFNFTIPLEDLKQLYHEWIKFCEEPKENSFFRFLKKFFFFI